ncbi:T9SS type A sorting domain-containing protein [bacterium]|nr:T9SS type A sorting domain-containing protein [bacterium]MBU1872237.1 T9SS type A sorting domain-containing protein [bacterium]
MSQKISRLIYLLLFSIISRGLVAQTWEEIEMHFPPGDTLGYMYSGITTFTTQNIGWLFTTYPVEDQQGNHYQIKKIYRTEDGGKNWECKLRKIGYNLAYYVDLFSLFSMTPDYFIAMYNDSIAGALISEDGGETWINSRITDDHLLSSISKIHFFDEFNGIAFNEDNRWFTSGGGYTWERGSDSKVFPTPSDVCFINDSLGWMVSHNNIYYTDAGYLANTTNGGKTWKYQDSAAVLMTGIDFIDSLKGFAVGTDFRFATAYLYSTTDGGKSWNIHGFYGEGEYEDVGFLDERFGWILGSDKILKTTDCGETWETQIDSIDCKLEKLIILKKYKVAYIFGNKDNKTLALYRADLSKLTSIENEPVSISQDFKLSQNYPNPFNSQTTIRYEINQNSYVQLKIFNILGEEVRTLIKEDQSPGNYQLCWDGTSDIGKPLESGIYICQLIMDDRIDTRKLILLK